MPETNTRRNSLEGLIPGAFELKPTERIEEIQVSSIRPNPHQPRKQFDEESIKELAESISSKGLLQPIIIRQVPGEAWQFELVTGERRLRAFKHLNKELIPALIRNVKEDDMHLVTLIENLQREDLNPIDESEGLSKLKTELQYTDEQISQLIGKSRSYITKILTISKIPQELKDTLKGKNDISARTLIELAKETDPKKIKSLTQQILDQGIKSEDIRNIRQVETEKPKNENRFFKLINHEKEFSLSIMFFKHKATPALVKEALEYALDTLNKQN